MLRVDISIVESLTKRGKKRRKTVEKRNKNLSRPGFLHKPSRTLKKAMEKEGVCRRGWRLLPQSERTRRVSSSSSLTPVLPPLSVGGGHGGNIKWVDEMNGICCERFGWVLLIEQCRLACTRRERPQEAADILWLRGRAPPPGNNRLIKLSWTDRAFTAIFPSIPPSFLIFLPRSNGENHRKRGLTSEASFSTFLVNFLLGTLFSWIFRRW